MPPHLRAIGCATNRLQTGSAPKGPRTPNFCDSMSQGACLVAAGRRFRVGPMSLAVATEGKSESDRALSKKAAQDGRSSVKLGINSLFDNVKIGGMGPVRHGIQQQALNASAVGVVGVPASAGPSVGRKRRRLKPGLPRQRIGPVVISKVPPPSPRGRGSGRGGQWSNG